MEQNTRPPENNQFRQHIKHSNPSDTRNLQQYLEIKRAMIKTAMRIFLRPRFPMSHTVAATGNGANTLLRTSQTSPKHFDRGPAIFLRRCAGCAGHQLT